MQRVLITLLLIEAPSEIRSSKLMIFTSASLTSSPERRSHCDINDMACAHHCDDFAAKKRGPHAAEALASTPIRVDSLQKPQTLPRSFGSGAAQSLDSEPPGTLGRAAPVGASVMSVWGAIVDARNALEEQAGRRRA